MKSDLETVIKIKKPVDQSSRAVEDVLRKNLHDRWNDYLAWRKKIKKKASPKVVHNLRRSIRKLQSMLDILTSILPAGRLEHLNEILDDELKALNDLRDVQVQRKAGFQGPLPFLQVGPFRSHLNKLEKKDSKKVRKLFVQNSLKMHQKVFLKIENNLTKELAGASPIHKIKALTAISNLLSHNYNDLIRCEAGIRLKDEKSFHKFRITLKDFNYKIEFLSSLFTGTKALSEHIKPLLKIIGRLQDRITLLDYSKGFLKKSKAHPHPKRELRQNIWAHQKKLKEEQIQRHLAL